MAIGPWQEIEHTIQDFRKNFDGKEKKMIGEDLLRNFIDTLNVEIKNVQQDREISYAARKEDDLNDEIEDRLLEAISFLSKEKTKDKITSPAKNLWNDAVSILAQVKGEIMKRHAETTRPMDTPIQKTRKKVDPIKKTEK